MSMKITVSARFRPGARAKLQKQMAKMKKTAQFGLAKGLYQEAEQIMGESKMPHNVPVKSGVLRSTGHVALPEMRRAGVTVRLGYGGPAATYSKKQHEDVMLRHPGGGRAKYLEIPAMQRASVLGTNVAKIVAVELAKAAKAARVSK